MAHRFFFLASLAWNFGVGMTWLALPLYASAQGLSNAEIADGLHLGVTTVKTHIGSLMTKTGATNRVRLAILAYRHGLLY